MSDKNTRFSFSKNNMATAAEMQKNAFGQTILGTGPEAESSSPLVEVTADSINGVLARPRSVADSPQLQEFLNKHINSQSAPAEPEPAPEPELLDLGDEAELDHFAKTVLDEPAPPAVQSAAPATTNLRRFSATIQSTLHAAKFCSECGFNFGSGEKFCPHCGMKRGTYEAPRQA